MRKVLAVILILILCMISVVVQTAETIELYVNSEKIYLYIEPIAENGRTLVPVRYISNYLDCTIEWDGTTDSVTVSDGQNTLKLTIDNSIYDWNGEQKELDVPPRLINDRTFVPIRVIAESFDYTVLWNETDNAVYMIKPLIKVEDIELEKLVDYGIISERELHGETYITTLEAIAAMNKMRNGGVIEKDLEDWWNSGYTLAPLDSLDDTTKNWLRETGDYRGIILPQELLEVNFDENLTNYKALVYVTRILGNSYTCGDHPKEFDYTEYEQTYQTAFYKGLISEIDMTHADEAITREDFYKILYRALYVKFTKGGYFPINMRYIDLFSEIAEA